MTTDQPAASQRTWTADQRNADGSTTLTIRRACNGCGRRIGDATAEEIDRAVAGLPLPDVTAECGCTSGRITVYRKLTDQSFPGPVMRYYYLTERHGQPWAAEIDTAVTEAGELFEWDDEPFGRSLRRDEIDEFFADAAPIGYIDADHNLHITERWRIPVGYGLTADFSPVITSTDWVGAPSKPHWIATTTAPANPTAKPANARSEKTTMPDAFQPQRFRKRPVEIEAMHLPEAYPEGVDPSSDGYARNLAAAKVLDWLTSHLGDGFDPVVDKSPTTGWSIDPADGALLIATLEGIMRAKPGDWIVRGVAGEFYPCKPDIFAATYEAVQDA